MRRPLIFCALSIVSTSAFAAPRKVLSARYPVSVREVAKTQALALGASTLEIETSKADLELIIWKVGASHALEVNIDTTGVNQSVLATDANGKLLSKVTELGAIPWIKVYWPGEAPKTLDVKCISRTNVCQGVWKNFPYDGTSEKPLKVEANLRGLEGKVWSPVINTHRVMNQNSAELGLMTAVANPPYRVQPKAKPARVRITALYDLMRMPREFANLKLLSVYEWSFLNDNDLRETGFLKTLYKTLFQADKGQFLLDTVSQSTLQTQDLLSGRAFFAEAGTIVSLASRKTKSVPESSLRALEFE
jgi:hypothetical protein